MSRAHLDIGGGGTWLSEGKWKPVAESQVGTVMGTYLERTLTARGPQGYGSLVSAAARWSPRASSASPLENRI